MFKKNRISFMLICFLIYSLCASKNIFGKPEIPSYDTKLSLENTPEIGGIAILRLTVTATFESIRDVDIGCFLPEDLELIGNRYKVEYKKSGFGDWGNNVTFFTGHMKVGEKKEFIFRVRVNDTKKYLIRAGSGIGLGDPLEIDLGDPEPPEWKPEVKHALVIDGKKYFPGRPRDNVKVGERANELIEVTEDVRAKSLLNKNEYYLTGIKQLKNGQATDLILPADIPVPLRTEFQMRTKDRPYYNRYSKDVSNHQLLIPARYLVYAENEIPDLKTSLNIPKGLEFVGAEKETYQQNTLEDGSVEVILYSGPMRFKQCMAFYFKVKLLSGQTEQYFIQVKSEFTTAEGKTLLKEDKLNIDLRPKQL